MGVREATVESMGVNANFWRGRRVLLTGHTGFKGGWLGLLLGRFGAQTVGFGLAPEVDRPLFEMAGVGRHLRSVIGDIRDFGQLVAAVERAEPEIILHLAAQALVLPSYDTPLDTFSTNVLGTANLLETARTVPGLRAVIVV